MLVLDDLLPCGGLNPEVSATIWQIFILNLGCFKLQSSKMR